MPSAVKTAGRIVQDWRGNSSIRSDLNPPGKIAQFHCLPTLAGRSHLRVTSGISWEIVYIDPLRKNLVFRVV